MKNIKYLFTTNIGRFLLSILLTIIGGVMSPNGTIGGTIYGDVTKTTIWDFIMMFGIVSLMIQSLVFIVYGLIINPLKSRKK